MFGLSDGEEILALASFVLIQYQSVTDRRIDRHLCSGSTSACIASFRSDSNGFHFLFTPTYYSNIVIHRSYYKHTQYRNHTNRHGCEVVCNTITQLRLLGFCISVTSLLGQWGQMCFSEFLKILSSFFAQNFCTDRVDILICSERNKNGVTVEIWHLGPSKYCGRRRQARARLRPRRVSGKFCTSLRS